MKSRSFSLLIVAIVAVNLATLAVWWHKTHRRARWTAQGPPPTYFKYGDRAPSFRFFSTKGQEIDSDSLGGKTVLLYFFDAEEDRHWSEILYAAMLAKAYEDRALEVVAVSKSRPRRLAEYVATVGVPVVVDDESLSAHELFHMRECCGGTVLVDSAGVIRFITPYLAPGGTMRQVHFGQLWRRKGDGGRFLHCRLRSALSFGLALTRQFPPVEARDRDGVRAYFDLPIDNRAVEAMNARAKTISVGTRDYRWPTIFPTGPLQCLGGLKMPTFGRRFA